jgi:NAD(P)H-flavin reductase
VILLFTVIHGAAVVLIGAVPWLIDVLFRLLYRPRVYAKGTAFPSSKTTNTTDVEAASPSRLGVIAREQVSARRLPGGITSLQFPRVRADTGETFKFKPGQYVFLCIPEISSLEWHPFSISSAPHEDLVTFHVRSLGDWTSKLANLVSTVSEFNTVPVPFDLFVDGPYGTLSIDLDGHLPTTNYSHVVILCGGIGITPMRSIVNQLHYESIQQKKRSWMRSVRLVWAVRDFDILSAFVGLDQSSSGNELASSYLPDRLLETTSGTPTAESNSTFRTEIFVTDESSTASATIGDVEAPIAPQLAHMLKLNDRPNISQILRETGERAQMETADAGSVVVLVCGPDAMVKDAISASISLTRELGVRFDVHHEYFYF